LILIVKDRLGLSKKLHVKKIVVHITLSQREKSDLAELAADLL
tara:strand:- start:594 stop:722 length:129 start_codon:yes stop_codon:yes gene_type:complete